MDIEKYKESMPRCKDCTGFGWGECKTAGENEAACKDFERKPKLTNGDRIRHMTDEELAEFLNDVTDCCFSNNDCDNCPMKYSDEQYYRCNIEAWLKQEVHSNDGTD